MDLLAEANLTSNITTQQPVIYRRGYDLPLVGMGDGLHIIALVCLCLSFTSAVAVITASFKHQKISTFFGWSKSERFAVYLAICDGMFNLVHSMDHLHIVISRDHVYPKSLCVFYGFTQLQFITAQNLMVNVVSINAFLLIYFRKNMDFGKCDWKLLSWMFGLPFGCGLIAVSFDVMGPNGAFCFFDAVKGKLGHLLVTTVPLLVILLMNAALYLLTWYRIRKEEPTFKTDSSNNVHVIRASHRAARAMSLFVAAFFIQWWAAALHGAWQIVDEHVPYVVFQCNTTFTNLGGVLNAVVYLIIRYWQHHDIV